MKAVAIVSAAIFAAVATAQQFNWYTDTNCQDYMTSTGNPADYVTCYSTPYGANSVLMVNCGDTLCAGWTFYYSNACTGESYTDGFGAPCTDCQTTCDSYRCIDIGDTDSFWWDLNQDSCPGEPGGHGRKRGVSALGA